MRKLNRDGFVLSYLSAISEEDYNSSLTDRNQLKLEAMLRRAVSEKKPSELPPCSLGIGDRIGNAEWQPYYSHGSIFVDRSSFYSLLQRIKMYVASVLVADEDITAEAVLWTYMSTGVYLNGKLISETEHPVYKPIQSVKCTLNLRKGRNELVFLSDNLGVRDTRNMLAFQILTNRDHILTTIPDTDNEEEYSKGAEFLDGIKIGRGSLSFSSEPPAGSCIRYGISSVDYEVKHRPSEIHPIGGSFVDIPEGIESCSVILRNGMKRDFEFSERIVPEYLPKRDSWDEHFRDIIRRIADVSMLDRGSHGFACFSLLARKYLGMERPDDIELLRNDIDLIKKRVDCSDFLMCGLLRYIHEYGLPEEVKDEAKDAITDYRYWMTMKGADGMCFWSENHSLMFWFSACDAGLLYPDELFHRTGMTGRELHAYGEKRVDEWLDDVLEKGYEEFLSSTYMAVTFAALLNVIDYCKESISIKARNAVDRILEMLAKSTFKGSVIAPMGRVYRGAIYPFRECAASLMNAVNEDAPYAYGEGWLSFLATSSYKIPAGLDKLMAEPVCERYSTGNAMVSVEKNDSYLLTSVISPRTDKEFRRWPNTIHTEGLDAEDNSFVKSLNECFHGTSCFQPGVYGYQQHMWSAALSGDALVFVNHPGTTSEDAELRPGYWNGNGVMPAITAEKGMIAAIYSIPENHPVAFTHLYIPFFRFDDVKRDGSWIFLSKDEGYLAIWASGELTSYDDMITDSELRLYSRKSAYLVKAGRKDEMSFNDFISSMKAMSVSLDEASLSLIADGRKILSFERAEDPTQYLD